MLRFFIPLDKGILLHVHLSSSEADIESGRVGCLLFELTLKPTVTS